MISVDFLLFDVLLFLLCQVPVNWYDNMLQCQKQNVSNCQMVAVDKTAYETVGISDAKLLLSPSCKQCLSDWHRISVISIEKQATEIIRCVFSSYVISDLFHHN